MADLITELKREFQDEMLTTRRILERVPQDKLSWKPHAKSRSLGELAWHVAAIPAMAANIAGQDEFAAGAAPPPLPATTADIVARFDESEVAGQAALAQLTPEALDRDWRLTLQGREVLRKSKAAALRVNLLNHLYHHRAQLGVYLRLLDVPVPMVYGPTADENPFAPQPQAASSR